MRHKLERIAASVDFNESRRSYNGRAHGSLLIDGRREIRMLQKDFLLESARNEGGSSQIKLWLGSL